MQDFTRLGVGNKTHRPSVDGYESGAALPREKTDGLGSDAQSSVDRSHIGEDCWRPLVPSPELTWGELRADGGGSRLVAAAAFVLASKPLLAPSREHWQKV